MRTRWLVPGIGLVLFGTVATFNVGLAQVEPYPVELKVGETFDVCASGMVGCPATYAMCDNREVAILVDVPGSGLGFRGVGPGSTLCSAASPGGGFRRVFRITVRHP